MPDTYVGASDQRTTDTRFAPFDRAGTVVASAYETHEQMYPGPGRVEHDLVGTWENTRTVVTRALRTADVDAAQLAGLRVTNQRETSDPVHNALVCQDRHTTDRVEEFEAGGDSAERAMGPATEGDT
jgi:Glycerol kinase